MAMSNVSINDGKAVPVAHVFVPQSGQLGSQPAVWYNKIASFSSLAWERLTGLVKLAPKPKGDHQMSIQIHQPKVVIVDGQEVLRGTISSYQTIVCPAELATEENLKDIKALAANAMDQTIANEIFVLTRPAT